MQQNYYARKIRQLKGLSKKWQQIPEPLRDPSAGKYQNLIRKIQMLIRELQSVFSKDYLARIAGAAIFLAGITFAMPASAQSFAKPVANPFGLQAADTIALPAFADLDGDGDMDLLVAENHGHVKYFQNTGTAKNPKFASPVLNPFGLDTLSKDSSSYVIFPAFADLDDDGDQDLLIGRYNNTFEYFQNIGTPSKPKFAAPVINPFGTDSITSFSAPAFVDLDGDGDMDLLVGTYGGNLEYFENIGTKTDPKFAAPVKNPFGLTHTYYYAFPAFADVDNDGDQDLLVGEYYGNLEYFKNTGTKTDPKFAAPVKNPSAIDSLSYIDFPAFADLDGDGDMDLLLGTVGDQPNHYAANLEYFENTLISTGIQPFFNDGNLKLYPNPAIEKLHLQTRKKIKKTEIFDLLGKRVAVFKGNRDELSLSGLKPDIYMVKITFAKGDVAIRKILKR